jgi:steroid delta-isomerase-like uncharacterized protein
MDATEMQALVTQHIDAEGRGDIEAAIAVYTDDVEHDVPGFPESPTRGKDSARAFYENLTANYQHEREHVLHSYVTDDAMILEHQMTGVVTGSMLGLPGNGRRIIFRTIHVFEFRDGLISRENVWLDSAAVIAQLS